jgi:hypothetical protein
MNVARDGRRQARRPTRQQRRARLAVLLVVVAVAVAGLISALTSGSLPKPPAATPAQSAGAGDPYGYVASREHAYVARAVAGNAHALFVKSPGGVVPTATRVAAYRGLIDRATGGTGIDPNLVEGLVFVESAGRAQIIAGSDPADAAGLSQILAQTGQSLLGMHINLARSRKLSAQINAVAAGTRKGRLGPLLARRAAIDDRFNPAREIAATVRYLRLAEQRFGGREDLAVESYHMGIGNLQQVLALYGASTPIPYAQVYFDSAPDRHAAAWGLLYSFNDDSSTYLWRVFAAREALQLYRRSPAQLAAQATLQTAAPSAEVALHPPSQTTHFAHPHDLAQAEADGTIVGLPATALARDGMAIAPSMGVVATRLHQPRARYLGLRPGALALLGYLGAQVQRIARVAPLELVQTVSDGDAQAALGGSIDDLETTGWAFDIARRYRDSAQALALQSELDRLAALDLISWVRLPEEIHITVASGAQSALAHGL